MNIRIKLNSQLTAVLATVALVALAGCKDKPTAEAPPTPKPMTETAKDKVNTAAEKTTEAMKDGAKKVSDTAEKAYDKTKDAVKDSAEAVKARTSPSGCAGGPMTAWPTGSTMPRKASRSFRDPESRHGSRACPGIRMHRPIVAGDSPE